VEDQVTNEEPRWMKFKGRKWDAYRLKQSGISNVEIAQKMGITQKMVGQHLRSASHNLEWRCTPHWGDGLGVRISNILNNFDIVGREQVMKEFKGGILSRWKNGGPRGYGWKTYVEVALWLGLPEPVKPPKCCQFCKRPF
jgi:hypothetical protein